MSNYIVKYRYVNQFFGELRLANMLSEVSE